MQRLLLVQKGQIYNQQMIASTQQLLETRLGAEGYAFAKVEPGAQAGRRKERGRDDLPR